MTDKSDKDIAAQEYLAVSASLASSLSTMALLLTLHFIFFGAIVSFISSDFFNLIRSADLFRYAIPVSVAILVIVFYGWSLAFVVYFRDVFFVCLDKAREIENIISAEGSGICDKFYQHSLSSRASRFLYFFTVSYFVVSLTGLGVMMYAVVR